MRLRALAASLALLGVLAPPLVRDAIAQTPDLPGSYVLDAGASDGVHRAIDVLIEDMGGLRRPFARLRLRELNQPPQRIDVAYIDSDESITTDGRDVIRTPADGRPVAWNFRKGALRRFASSSIPANRSAVGAAACVKGRRRPDLKLFPPTPFTKQR